MSEYGQTKSLNEILQDLVSYCKANTGMDVELKLHLPRTVLGSYSKIAQPKEKIVLSGETSNPDFTLRKVYLNGGTVELSS